MANSRVDLVRRQSEGAAQRDCYVQAIRGFGVPEICACLLPLDESDAVRNRSRNTYAARNAADSGVVERKVLFDRLDRIDNIIPISDGDVFVIPWNAELVGIFRWPADVLNGFWKQLIQLEPDGFIVVDSAFSSKLVVQVVDDIGVKEVDFAAWGNAWKTLISGFRA